MFGFCKDFFREDLKKYYLVLQGELEKAIVLQTSPDTILEGREEFIVSLVSADNNADISNTGMVFSLPVSSQR